jgi:Zn-dependent protease
LDGGRILVGLLPRPAAIAVSKVEPYGLFILIGLLILLPLLGNQLGVDLDFIARWMEAGTRAIFKIIVLVTGNA